MLPRLWPFSPWLALTALAFSLSAGCSCADAPSTSAPPATAGAGGGGGDAAPSSTTSATGPAARAELILQFGPDLAPAVARRIEAHLTAAAPLPVVVAPAGEPLSNLNPGSLVLAFGETTSTRSLVTAAEQSAAGSEGFVLRSGTIGGAPALVAAGNPLIPDPFGHPSLGVAYGAYALLEELGFAFLHPLAPAAPQALSAPSAAMDRAEHPHWPIRGLHLHTMHPLELTDLLQGFGPGGAFDEAGWEAMLPEWDAFLEWMLANHQNRVTWALLRAESWDDFAESPTRQTRLQRLVARGHDFGIAVGIDAPIVLQQQHAFQLITQKGELDGELSQIHRRIDYLMETGLDFLKVESGTTEFTAPSDGRMLAWMNEVAAYTGDVHGAEAFIKIHCSTGQTAPNHPDPDTGEPINFNFLPHFADPRLGVLPHTVQHYGLLDPAPTYGNTDFGYIREFLHEEAGARKVVWYPETAYWVSFDIDVPLFLPLYAERRFADLRLLARDELEGRMGRGPHAGARMDGQLTFSSGWEWGYWLQEAVTARAAWNPHLDIADDRQALRAVLAEVTRPFGQAAEATADLLMEAMEMERDLLIEGKIAGEPPEDVTRRNGQAYLQGVETWDDIADLAAGLGYHPTQPDKLGLVEMRNPLHAPPGYSAEVEPLLAEMEARFTTLADRFEALAPSVPAHARPLFDDLVAASRITALRATHVHGLYDYVDGYWTAEDAWRQMRLATARGALDEALALVARREPHYRVDPERIAGWRDNPTAYEFGYLWTVRSLYYWWRDEGKAVDTPVSPCYRNIISPVDVGLGEGLGHDAANVLAEVFDRVPGIGSIAECAAAPAEEPSYSR